VLRQRVWPALDGKEPEFESPATFLALVCNYRDISVSAGWEVLKRTRSRCGPPRLLASVRATAGELVSVPAKPNADDLVFARIRLHEPLWQRLQTAVFKQLRAPEITVGTESYRFLETTAAGPLTLRMPVGSGIADAFGGAVDYGRLSLAGVPSPFTIDYFAVRVAGAGKVAVTTGAGLLLRRGALLIGGHVVPVADGVVTASVDSSAIQGGLAVVNGWAADVADHAPATKILVFVGGRLAAQGAPTIDRPDVADAFHDPRLTHVGYTVTFPARALSRGVRVFAVAGGKASEAHYPVRYAWGTQ
jgi:hypothetical protein